MVNTNNKGLTLLELIICTLIIGILSSVALPISKNFVRRQQEHLLRERLTQMRQAIDRYYFRKVANQPGLEDWQYYPSSLEQLVEKRYLRRIAVDPFTGEADWIRISSTDPVDSNVSDNRNLFDVQSASDRRCLRDTPYSSW